MLHVGLDIHTKHISICVLNETGQIVHRSDVRSIDQMMRILNIGAGTLINGTTGVRFDGVTVNDQTGAFVATGDVNGDGIADLAIGAYSANNHAGYTYIIFGKRTGWGAAGNVVLNTGYGKLIDGTQGVRFDGVTTGNNSGYSVTTGDVNGDGIPDLVIGARGGNSLAGYTYVVFGNNAILPTTTVTTTAGSSSATVGSYAGLQVGQTLTASTIPAGITISACSAAANGACASTTITLSTGTGVTAGTNIPVTVATTPLNIGTGTLINGITGARFDGPTISANDDDSGYPVATGDINGDGIPDLIIGAVPTYGSAGYVYIYNGRASGWPVPSGSSGYNLGGL